MTRAEIRDAILRRFEAVREAKGSLYEPERILAYLTAHPEPKGRRTADTFAGRRRFVRFMDSVQLEFGVCFTLAEWERGVGLDELVELVEKKRGSPQQQERLAVDRLHAARRTLTGEPVTFGLIAGLLLVLLGLAAGPAVRILLVLLWVAVVGTVVAVNAAQYRYAQRLIARIRSGAGGRGASA